MKHHVEGGGLADSQDRRLRLYAELLQKYAPRLGLLSPADVERVWERHILDSLRGLRCLSGADRSITDLGSGAGLPGIPIAVARPDAKVVLIEPKGRRAAFLELAAQELRLENVVVRAKPAEIVEDKSDACLVRAFGPVAHSWRTASRLLNPRGRVLYYAGRSWSETASSELVELGATLTVCDPPQSPWQGPILVMSRAAAGRE